MVLRIGLSLLIVLAAVSLASAAPTAEQKAEIQAVGEMMTKAGVLFKEKKFGESGDVIRQAQEKIDELGATGDKIILRQLEPHHKRLKTAHALLELEGIELPELVPLAEAKKPEKPEKTVKSKNELAGDAGGLSFVKHVVPVLIARCGNCHVNQAKGEFSAASYAALMKGAGAAGKVVFPGDAMGSRIIEVIDSGDMPRGGQKLTPAEYQVLTKWINDGAKFDGADENGLIAALSSAPMPTKPVEPTIVQATGKETVSFAKEIAPALAQNCNGCHGVMRPRENFSLATFTTLMKGGDGGLAVTPGDGPGSLILKKLKGTGGGQRMPAGGLPPFADTLIAKIETWIAEGAKFDGPDANAPLSQVAALAKAAGSTHEELSADRMKAAEATWNTGMPAIKNDVLETANYYFAGTVGENTLKHIADQAEQLSPQVAEILGAPADRPLIKGRLSLFVVATRYDYGELGMVLSGATSPPKGLGYWRYDGVDAAAVVLNPKNESDYAINVLVAQQLASAAVAASGKNVPKWFSEGVGRVTAARLAASDPRVKEWDAALQPVFSSLTSYDAFLSTKFEPEAAGIAGYSYTRYLMNDARRFNQLMDGLRKGGKFDDLFMTSYGNTPNAIAEVWHRKGPGRPRTSKPSSKPTANKSAKSP